MGAIDEVAIGAKTAQFPQDSHSRAPKRATVLAVERRSRPGRCQGMGRDRRSPTEIARSRNRRRNRRRATFTAPRTPSIACTPNAIATARSRRFARFAECACVRRTSLRAIAEHPGRRAGACALFRPNNRAGRRSRRWSGRRRAATGCVQVVQGRRGAGSLAVAPEDGNEAPKWGSHAEVIKPRKSSEF